MTVVLDLGLHNNEVLCFEDQGVSVKDRKVLREQISYSLSIGGQDGASGTGSIFDRSSRGSNPNRLETAAIKALISNEDPTSSPVR